jgi:hypothetical protein
LAKSANSRKFLSFTFATGAESLAEPFNLKIFMGDRSPKSVQKQAKQKQTKSTSASQKKQQATTAKQTPKKK